MAFRDDEEAAAGRILLWGSLGVVGLLLAAVGVFYLMDGRIDATVEDKTCLPGLGSSVAVQTDLFGIDHTVTDVPLEACTAVVPGNYVQYHVRSGRTILWDHEGGRCIYDSEEGLGC